MNYFSLRNTTALEDWWDRDHPPLAQWQTVCLWVYGLYDGYWQAPSVSIEQVSSRPNFEVREAIVPNGGGVVVLFQYHHVEVWTDLIYVG